MKELIDFKKYLNLDVDDRLDLHYIFMQTALLFSTRSECQRKHVGCVITQDNRIVSVGYNGNYHSGPACTYDDSCPLDSAGTCLRSIHAETNALAFCAKHSIKTDGATMYITLSPCLSCAKMIVQSGIKRIYYLEEYRNIEGLEYIKNTELIKVYKYGEQ